MKLNLKSRRNIVTKASPFDALVQEAMSVVRKLETLRAFPACKLTADAYLAETLTADPAATLKGVSTLRKALERKPLPPSLMHSARTLARMIAGLRGPAWGSPPVKFPWRLQTSFSTPEATGELIGCGSNTIELFGVAVQIVDERAPDTFGICENSSKHAAQVADLAARRDELFRQLDSRVSGEDLNIDAVDPHAPVTFKIAPTVPLAPRSDAGQRLVNYLMAQREQQSA